MCISVRLTTIKWNYCCLLLNPTGLNPKPLPIPAVHHPKLTPPPTFFLYFPKLLKPITHGQEKWLHYGELRMPLSCCKAMWLESRPPPAPSRPAVGAPLLRWFPRDPLATRCINANASIEPNNQPQLISELRTIAKLLGTFWRAAQLSLHLNFSWW